MSTPPINSSSSSAQVANTVNDVNRELQALKTTQVFKDDSGKRRVLLGNDGNGFVGMKVSKEGIDVVSATAQQLLFSTDSNTVFNVVGTGTINSPAVSFANPGAGNFQHANPTATAAHGLSYLPAIIAYVSNSAGTLHVLAPYTVYEGTGTTAGLWLTVDVAVDSTNVIVQVEVLAAGRAVNFPAGDFTVKYFLLQETIN